MVYCRRAVDTKGVHTRYLTYIHSFLSDGNQYVLIYFIEDSSTGMVIGGDSDGQGEVLNRANRAQGRCR